MGHKKACHHKKKKKAPPDNFFKKSQEKKGSKEKLEIILKCDSTGSLEVVRSSILNLVLPEVTIEIIHASVGDISNSDIFMAETGSRLIIGFNVGVAPKIDHLLKEHNMEIRLYEVIYRLTEDIKSIAESLFPTETSEEIIGTAKVIALFKSSRKGIILGCEVLKGHLAIGGSFRIISAIGPVYSGKIRSLHIEKDTVNKATVGQQVGVKIENFNKAKINDLVEAYRSPTQKKSCRWFPSGKIMRP